MRVVAVVSKILKPVLSSAGAPVLRAPCRTITIGKDGIKFGNIGGKLRGREQEPQEDPLDNFLGKWVQELSVFRTPDGEIKAPEITEEMLQEWYRGITASYYEPPAEKPIIYYQKNGPRWRVRTGFQHTGYNINYGFRLGTDFMMHYPENGLYRVLVFQDGSYMKWTFQPYYYGAEMVPQLKLAIHQITEVREDKLIWKTEFPDMSVSTRTYVRA